MPQHREPDTPTYIAVEVPVRRVERKRCYHCRLLKTSENLDQFYKNGTDDYCKACRKILAHAYYLRKKDKVLTRNKVWRTNNPETYEEARKAWREAHPEKVLTYDRNWKTTHGELIRERQREQYEPEKAKIKNDKYRLEHPEEFAAAKKHWNQENPDKVQAHNAAGRARRKHAAISDFTAGEWEFLSQELYHHCCVYCGEFAEPLAKEHIIALTKGGNHTLSNILPSCTSCNSKKGTKYFIVPHLLRCADGVERKIQLIKNK